MAIIKGTSENFEQEVLQAEKPVLVDFWAEWCGPCQMIAPILEQIASEKPEITICKVNVDEEMALAQKFQVAYIPYLLLFKNGEVAETITGMHDKEEIMQMIEKA